MINTLKQKNKIFAKRKLRSKKHLKSSAERPRMVIFRSNKYLYVQVIDDTTGKVLCSISSIAKELEGKKLGNNIESAKKIGEMIGKKLKKLKIEKVVFDRNGNLYHGKIKALAEACREQGIQF